MKIYEKNDYIIGTSYQSKEQNGLIITNRNDDNIVKVVSCPYGMAKTGDIIAYNKDKAQEFNIGGVTYIAFKFEDMIACIEEDK